MLILALDSSGSSCAVGVWRDGAMLSHAREDMGRGQDARLMPMVVSAMAEAKCDFVDLDRVAVTRGPGSFTGVRVGLAAARGIGIAAEKPVVGVDRFSIYRELHADVKNLLVVIQSKRAELFCRFYSPLGKAQEACMMTEAEIQAFAMVHPDMQIAGDITSRGADIMPILARLAANADTKSAEFLPQPLYLRAPDVSFAKVR